MTAALDEAERARHSYVGCEHLLLALLRDAGDQVARLLSTTGVELDNARAAVLRVVAEGRGDGPRWNQVDLLASVGVDLAAIQRQVRAEFGARAVDELYASRFGRRLPRGPLCGLSIAPALKSAFARAVDTAQREGGDPDRGHLLLGLLETASPGTRAVLAALGTSPEQVHTAAAGLLRAS